MTVPFTVIKGHPDDADTEAIGQALAAVVAEAAASATDVDARETLRVQARTHPRGRWGTPSEKLAGVRTFSPTGFRG
jgi:hypothetical protein